MIRIATFFLFFIPVNAQFIDNFDTPFQYDESAENGWTFFSGDGQIEMEFEQSSAEHAAIYVNAENDKRNLWWAVIRRRVSRNMDLSLLEKKNYEFRIEAKIKVNSAPKRVNLHLNTQRTTDFHSHLMEFDIPDTNNWHTISMTTKDFDAVPGDRVYGQLALMDWGFENYIVQLDYVKVDIVDINKVGPDKGTNIPYRPPIPEIEKFKYHLVASQDATLDKAFPGMNFNNWSTADGDESVKLLNVNGKQFIILKWDLDKLSDKVIEGAGLLELTTYSIQRSPEFKKDFGMIRVTEITGGDSNWDQEDVTYESFLSGKKLNEVINSQMIIDINANEKQGSKSYITISKPVLQRIIEGKTLGIALQPLGSVSASFYSLENNNETNSAKLHFNIREFK